MSPSVVLTPPETPPSDPAAAGPTSAPPARDAGRAELDLESRDWLARLQGGGAEYDAAVAALHQLLLKAARFELNRRRATVAHLRGDDYDDLAQQCADDALMAVLGKLGEFRGESRFTTWAYKFALFEAGVKVRRRAWQGREIPLEEEAWARLATGESAADEGLTDARAAIEALPEAIGEALSARQREVLVAVALNDVPIDVLAERLQTTRGALYKSLHDARRKLRAALTERGIEVGSSGSEGKR